MVKYSIKLSIIYKIRKIRIFVAFSYATLKVYVNLKQNSILALSHRVSYSLFERLVALNTRFGPIRKFVL